MLQPYGWQRVVHERFFVSYPKILLDLKLGLVLKVRLGTFAETALVDSMNVLTVGSPDGADGWADFQSGGQATHLAAEPVCARVRLCLPSS